MVLHKVKKGGSQFAQGMENTKGQARSSGSNVAESGNSGLKVLVRLAQAKHFLVDLLEVFQMEIGM